jgi:hypothetical protein
VLIKNKKEVWDFIAKYFGDLSKAIVTVGVASYFFKEMPMPLRILCGVMALVFLVISVIIINNQQGEES